MVGLGGGGGGGGAWGGGSRGVGGRSVAIWLVGGCGWGGGWGFCLCCVSVSRGFRRGGRELLLVVAVAWGRRWRPVPGLGVLLGSGAARGGGLRGRRARRPLPFPVRSSWRRARVARVGASRGGLGVPPAGWEVAGGVWSVGPDGLHGGPRPGRPGTVMGGDVGRVAVQAPGEPPGSAAPVAAPLVAPGTGARQSAVRRVLARVRAEAAPDRDLQPFRRPAVHRQGQGRRRPLSRSARACAGALCRREVPDPGARPLRAGATDPAGSSRPGATRLTSAPASQPVPPPWSWARGRCSPSCLADTAPSSSVASSTCSTPPSPGRLRGPCARATSSPTRPRRFGPCPLPTPALCLTSSPSSAPGSTLSSAGSPSWTTKRIQRSAHRSVQDLDASIPTWITHWNANPSHTSGRRPPTRSSTTSPHIASESPTQVTRSRHGRPSRNRRGNRVAVRLDRPAAATKTSSGQSSSRPTSATGNDDGVHSRRLPGARPRAARPLRDLRGRERRRLYAVGDAEAEFTIMSVVEAVRVRARLRGARADRGARRCSASTAPACRSTRSRPSSGARDGRTNPMVNPGAIATTSLVPGADAEEKWQLHPRGAVALRRPRARARRGGLRARRPRPTTATTASPGCSQATTGSTAIRPRPSTSTRGSARSTSARTDLAVMGATLAERRRQPAAPASGGRRRAAAGSTLAVMATAGLYETSGDWLYDVGLPGKSGIGGGIVTVAPGKGGLGTFAPPLDERGQQRQGPARRALPLAPARPRCLRLGARRR